MRLWLIFLFSVACVFSPLVAPVPPDRAHDLARQANKLETQTCEDVQTVDDCHNDYPAGCSDSENLRYDAYLNFLKDQMPDQGLPVTKTLSEADFGLLDKEIPATLTKRNHAKEADDLANLGEGNIFGVIGYLYYAKQTGRESCNCELTGGLESDYHIGIGFDPDVAAKLRSGTSTSKTDLEQSSVVVEMTPQYCEKVHPQWTLASVNNVVGEQVKVVGQLMVDNEHAAASQDCGRINSDKQKCWRASAWEIHPVTQFYVCKTNSPCANDSGDWVKLEDMR